MPDYRNCERDADFDKFFSECAVLSTGCDAYSKKIRTTLIAARNSAIKNTEKILKNIVAGYQNSRKQKLDSTRKSCKDDSLKKKCINLVCNTNMPHKCDTGYEYEETLAGQLCKFYDTACERVK